MFFFTTSLGTVVNIINIAVVSHPFSRKNPSLFSRASKALGNSPNFIRPSLFNLHQAGHGALCGQDGAHMGSNIPVIEISNI